VAAEAQGEPLVIQEHLYKAAADQQEQRLLHDPWEDKLANVKGTFVTVDGTRVEERISSTDLLSIRLSLPADKQTDAASKRLANVMNRLGWEGPKKIKFEGTALQGYWRLVPQVPD
jgi:hypothetical protein